MLRSASPTIISPSRTSMAYTRSATSASITGTLSVRKSQNFKVRSQLPLTIRFDAGT
jgi:hypothetical protein